MASLTDTHLIQRFARLLESMYDNWGREVESQRKLAFAGEVRNLCVSIGMPVPTVAWGDNGGSFDWEPWKLECDQRAFRLDPHQITNDTPNPLKAWLYFSTSVYHELRHGEQYWMIAKALMANKFPMPVAQSRAVVVGGDSPSKLSSQMWYSPQVARQAWVARGSFSDQDLAKTRAWCDSVFGRYSRQRQQTLRHLNRRGEHMNKYVNLPEEADAWAVERLVSRAMRERLQGKAQADAMTGLSNLFG